MKTIITLMAISIIQTTLAASYFEQEKDLAKKTLAKRETSAKMEMRETEASIIKSSNDIKFVIYRPDFLESGDLFIGGLKANTIHSFSSDYDFALVVDRQKKLPSSEASELYQLLSHSNYRSYRFDSFSKATDFEKLPLELPAKSELTLILFSSLHDGQEVFPEVFSLRACGKEIEPKKSNGAAKIYYFQQNDQCTLEYRFQPGNQQFTFFNMINNATAVVQEQVERSREVITRYERLLRKEQKQVKPDASKISLYQQKVDDQKKELKRLKEFLVNIKQ